MRLNQTYTLNYASAPPLESRYQIQKRQLTTDSQNDRIVVKLKFPRLISAEVVVNNSTMSDVSIQPIPLVNNV